MRLSDFSDKYYKIKKDESFASLCNLTSDTGLGCLSFALNESYIKKACTLQNITALIVPPQYADMPELLESGKGIAVSEEAKSSFYLLHNDLVLSKNRNYIAEYSKTVIGRNCKIHPSASIAEEGVIIGDNVTIEENVIIREGVTIGDNSVILAGAYIGYSACLAGRDLKGNLLPIFSVGSVTLGCNVMVGAYSSIAKGLFPYERAEVGDYSMIGFSTDLSHNSRVGKNVIVLDQSQICGNTILEDDVHIAPHAIVSNRLKIEKFADVSIGSVVVSNIKKGIRVAGNYAIESSKFLLWHRNKMRTK